jgi:hypothetical protein
VARSFHRWDAAMADRPHHQKTIIKRRHCSIRTTTRGNAHVTVKSFQFVGGRSSVRGSVVDGRIEFRQRR